MSEVWLIEGWGPWGQGLDGAFSSQSIAKQWLKDKGYTEVEDRGGNYEKKTWDRKHLDHVISAHLYSVELDPKVEVKQ